MPYLETLADACGRAGLDVRGARPLRVHSNAVFLLPVERVVARIGTGADARARAERSVAVSRWLTDREFPCLTPLAVAQPVLVAETPVTFWEYVEPVGRLAHASALGGLLRRLHALTGLPPGVEPLRPLTRFLAAVEGSSVLADDDRGWLVDRARFLLGRYAELRYPLGEPGLVHGDAQVGNVLVAADGRVLLGDWDGVCVAAREWDLVLTAAEDRWGMPTEERAAFAAAYGFDVTTWPEWTVLRDLKELHSPGAHLRRAPTSPPHAEELAWRIASARRRPSPLARRRLTAWAAGHRQKLIAGGQVLPDARWAMAWAGG